MNIKHIGTEKRSPLIHQLRAAIAVAAALETALTSSEQSAAGGWSLTFTFVGEPQLKAARDAWRAYAVATIDTPAPLAATANQRLTAQIGLALFNDPTLDLMQIANQLARARAGSQGALLPEFASEAMEARHGRS
ncbi:hypothetical protein HMPREF3113_10355 [Stenotrophomonas sp. HMSC10F06]|uniref:hypothetical protein n=1 Tax=Stenotrophomonas sp. HMSC10F06 TaxID=1581081 RepID=UPI0008A533B8|nr:hypothetical protein [Stenotrophomonas sp. HMSC10F06]OFS93139.1 hypothetical protein HMPREF3113_10355 [Stenotrophomonas sp. HMSC10F06]